MKILFLALDVDIEGRFGDSIHVRELTSYLAKLGYEVILVTAKPKFSRNERRSAQKNLHIYSNTGKGTISILRSCKNIIKRHQPHVIYERRFSAKTGAALSALYNIPLVIEINGLVEEEERIMGTLKKESSLVSLTKKKMRKRFFHKAKRIVAVTEGIKSSLHEQYDVAVENIEVVPNGANVEIFKPMNQKECKIELGLDTNKKYVCFVGNLAPWQGLDHLLKAAPLVLKRTPNTHFLLVGDGISKKDIQDLAEKLEMKDSITFVGSVPYEKVPKYINACDICVTLKIKKELRSGYSPLKLFEYLACEKAIVASYVRGIEEIVMQSNCGLLVRPDDPKELTEAIIRLLSDEKLREEMGRRGRELVVRDYSWMNVAKRIAHICQDVTT